ncbi:MAG TPA: MFS transporter [Bryobacteraceae bacterium]|nr:MFS transporter [Bryobacteraceae bacterium]
MSVTRQSAVRFIVSLGMISLLADVTYEGARSVNGPFLATLGAGAAVIGMVSGFGELVGYVLRLLSGAAADRSKRYWALTIFGYCVNLLAVPLMAFTHHWVAAAALIVLERAGKAVRTPARDVMLSQASKIIGRGWGFGLHEAMDQLGAFTGPLLVAYVLKESHLYPRAYGVLAIPAVLGITTLLTARFFYPDPSRFEEKNVEAGSSQAGFGRTFWLYVVAAGFIAAGIVDFPLIAYHFVQAHITTVAEAPVFYSAAMGVEALAALVFGRLFDRLGVISLLAGVLLLAASNPLVFLGSFWMALAGMLCWGAGAGAINASLRAEIAELVPAPRRGTAYGIFNTVYGLLWFLGSAGAGFLYGYSVIGVVVFAVALEAAAVPFLLAVRRRRA